MTGHPDIARLRMHSLGVWSPTAATPREAVRSLVAVQAQEHRYARWSIAQRVGASTTAADIDVAFDDGELLRTHVLRPTWHYVAPDDLRWLMELSGPRVNAWNARRYDDLGLSATDLERSLTTIHEALSDGPLTRQELGEVIGVTREKLAFHMMHAELSLCVCSGPMKGRFHTYARFDDRVPPSSPIDEDEALARLASRYLSTRAAATAKDFAWWAGLKMADARRALALAGATSVTIDGRTYFHVGDFVEAPVLTPRADLVQCYDEVIVSFTESRDLLRTERATFPVPGRPDAGFAHVVLLDGRLLGHWRVDSDDVIVRLAHEVDARAHRAVEAATERYRGWVSGR